jgi:hypothetical protein
MLCYLNFVENDILVKHSSNLLQEALLTTGIVETLKGSRKFHSFSFCGAEFSLALICSRHGYLRYLPWKLPYNLARDKYRVYGGLSEQSDGMCGANILFSACSGD